MLPAQNTPPVLSPLRLSDQVYTSRKQASGTPRSLESALDFRYALSLPECWLITLCPQAHSGETTRGPPRMDPPRFC
jgi:hypothetical protein